MEAEVARAKRGSASTPQQSLEAPTTVWSLIEVQWYDGQRRMMEIASDTAVWFHYVFLFVGC
jgi:hypothetical protein